MPRITIAQLQSEVERLRAHCDHIETQLARVTTERDEAVDGLHRLKSEMLAAKLPQPAVTTIATKPAPTESAPKDKVLVNGRWLPAHMAAAREAAMRMNRVVKVGA